MSYNHDLIIQNARNCYTFFSDFIKFSDFSAALPRLLLIAEFWQFMLKDRCGTSMAETP